MQVVTTFLLFTYRLPFDTKYSDVNDLFWQLNKAKLPYCNFKLGMKMLLKSIIKFIFYSAGVGVLFFWGYSDWNFNASYLLILLTCFINTSKKESSNLTIFGIPRFDSIEIINCLIIFFSIIAFYCALIAIGGHDALKKIVSDRYFLFMIWLIMILALIKEYLKEQVSKTSKPINPADTKNRAAD